MKLLLDTCCWLWWLSEPSKLSQQQLQAISNRQNQLFLSTASIWEIGIKVNRNKLSCNASKTHIIEIRKRINSCE